MKYFVLRPESNNENLEVALESLRVLAAMNLDHDVDVQWAGILLAITREKERREAFAFASRQALVAFAENIRSEDFELSESLNKWVAEVDSKKK